MLEFNWLIVCLPSCFENLEVVQLKFALRTKQWLEMWPAKPKKIGSNQSTKTPKSEKVLQWCKRPLPNVRQARPAVLHSPTK
jgi:hypothetical protein